MNSPDNDGRMNRLLHRPAPPTEVWDRIEAEINKPANPLTLLFNRYKPWLMATSAAAALLLAIAMVTWKISLNTGQETAHRAHMTDPADRLLHDLSLNEDRPDLVLYAAVIREKLNQLNNAIQEYEELLPVNAMNGRISMYLEQVLEEREQTIEELKQTVRETKNENPG